MGRKARLHRKDWEWVYIPKTLSEADMLRGERMGFGFAVGREPLSALFASCGCDILATDQETTEQAPQSGWAFLGKYSNHSKNIFQPDVYARNFFLCHVKYRNLDVDALPKHQDGP